MNLGLRVLAFSFCLQFVVQPVDGQERQDSVEVIMITYQLLEPVDKFGMNVQIVNPMLWFHYFLYNDNVLIKEVYDPPSSGHRFFETSINAQWSCEVLDEHVFIAHVPRQFKRTPVQLRPDSMREILGMQCAYAVATLNDVDHHIWYSGAFGFGFSTIAEIPGIPLYYEKTDFRGVHNRFLASSIDTVRAPAYLFEPDQFRFGTLRSSSDLLKKPPTQSRREIAFNPINKIGPSQMIHFKRDFDGREMHTRELKDRGIMISFLDLGNPNLDQDFGLINSLHEKYKNEGITFIVIVRGLESEVAEIRKRHRVRAHFSSQQGNLFNRFKVESSVMHFVYGPQGQRIGGFPSCANQPKVEAEIEGAIIESRSRAGILARMKQ